MVVSDCASVDHTWQVISSYRDKPYVRAVRLSAPAGYLANWANAVEAASGEYIWMVGDDDWIVPGGVNHVLSTVANHISMDYFFTNHFFAPVQQRNHLIKQELDGGSTGAFRPPLKRCARQVFEDHSLAKWEDLWDLPPGGGLWLHTSIVGHILRRRIWLANTPWMKALSPHEKPSPRLYYPHNVIVAEAMVGRPCYFIGKLSVLMSGGAQEWGRIWPILTVVVLPQVVALYRSLGVDKRMVEVLLSEQLRYGGKGFFGMCRDRKLRTEGGFSILLYVKEYGLHPGFWIGLWRAPIAYVKKVVLGLWATCIGRNKGLARIE